MLTFFACWRLQRIEGFNISPNPQKEVTPVVHKKQYFMLNSENQLVSSLVHTKSNIWNKYCTIHFKQQVSHRALGTFFTYCNFWSPVQFGGKRMRDEYQLCTAVIICDLTRYVISTKFSVLACKSQSYLWFKKMVNYYFIS